MNSVGHAVRISSPGFLSYLMLYSTLITLGRLQEVFTFLWPLRLAMVTFFVMGVAMLMNGGMNMHRLHLLWFSQTFRRFVLFLAIMAASVLFSVYMGKSLGFLKEFVLYCGVFLLALNCQVNRREDFEYVLSGAVLTLIALGLICFLHPRGVESRVAASFTYDPNDTALLFVMILALVLPAYKHVGVGRKWVLRGVALLSLGAIILTQSRGGLVALVGTLSAWALSRGFKGVMRFAILGGLTLVLVLAVTPPEKLERFTSLVKLEQDYNLESKHGRIEVWKNGFELFRENWLTGTGLSTFAVAEGQTHRGGKWSEAHNAFIEVATELGIFGFAAFLAMLVSAYRNAGPRDEADWLGKGIRLSLTAYFFGGMFLSWGYNFVLYFVLFIAMIRERVMALEQAAPVAEPVQKDRKRIESCPTGDTS